MEFRETIKLPPLNIFLQFGSEIKDPPQKENTKLKPIKNYLCNFCNFSSIDKSDLVRHKNDRHNVIKLFQCPICGKCSKQGGNLKPHSQKEHACNLNFLESRKRYKVEKNNREVKIVVGKLIAIPTILKLLNKSEAEFLDTIVLMSDEELKQKAISYQPVFRNFQ